MGEGAPQAPPFPADPPTKCSPCGFCRDAGPSCRPWSACAVSLGPPVSLSLSLLPGEGGEGGGASGLVLFAGLEGHLQHALTQAVAIEAGDGHGRLVVVGHGDEAEALALVGGEVTDDLDVGDRPEGPEQLPKNTLVRFRRQVVHEDAPASACCTPRQAHACKAAHAIDGDG